MHMMITGAFQPDENFEIEDKVGDAKNFAIEKVGASDELKKKVGELKTDEIKDKVGEIKEAGAMETDELKQKVGASQTDETKVNTVASSLNSSKSDIANEHALAQAEAETECQNGYGGGY